MKVTSELHATASSPPHPQKGILYKLDRGQYSGPEGCASCKGEYSLCNRKFCLIPHKFQEFCYENTQDLSAGAEQSTFAIHVTKRCVLQFLQNGLSINVNTYMNTAQRCNIAGVSRQTRGGMRATRPWIVVSRCLSREIGSSVGSYDACLKSRGGGAWGNWRQKLRAWRGTAHRKRTGRRRSSPPRVPSDGDGLGAVWCRSAAPGTQHIHFTKRSSALRPPSIWGWGLQSDWVPRHCSPEWDCHEPQILGEHETIADR
jgi:hypothetical protein